MSYIHPPDQALSIQNAAIAYLFLKWSVLLQTSSIPVHCAYDFPALKMLKQSHGYDSEFD